MMRPTVRRLTFLLAPSDAELDAMLVELGKAFPKRDLASVLGISTLTLEGWRRRKNRPTAAARKLIWLLWTLFLHPKSVFTAFDVMTWGRFRVEHREE